MIEIAMALCLTVMGIYFFKSTDLPKDLKERSAQHSEESSLRPPAIPKKMNFPKVNIASTTLKLNQTQLVNISEQKKIMELEILNQEIDKLTMTITTLEQNIKKNNVRNNEIQSIIDLNLVQLQALLLKTSTLA